MCLIVETKKDIPLSEKFIKNVFKRNDDGFGLMYIKDNHLETEKYVDKSVDLLVERYNATKEYEPIIHFRMRTHGLIDHSNTHPYYANFGIWLMHNGVLQIDTSSNKDKSDTWHFIHTYLNPMLSWSKNPHALIRTEQFKTIINRMIGPNNKIVMGDRGGYVFFQEKQWHTITKESTEMVGMRVSNTYAWDESFNEPPKVYALPTAPAGSYTTSSAHVIRRYSKAGLIQIDDKLYADYAGEIWEEHNNGKDSIYWFKVEEGTLSKNKKKKIAKKIQRVERKATEAKLKKLAEEGAKQMTLTYEEKKEETTAPVCVPGTEPVIPTLVVNQDDDNDDITSDIILPSDYTELDYTETLVREYRQMSESLLHSMVYTNPDEASRILHHLLRRTH